MEMVVLSDFSFTFETAYLEIILCIALLTIGFLCFWSIYEEGKFSALLIDCYGEKRGHLYHIIARRWIGALLYGVIPAIVLFAFTPYSWSDYGVAFQGKWSDLSWLLVLTILIPILTFRTARRADSLAIYPEIRFPQWSNQTFALSVSAWLVYLLAYELMYRGFLLFSSVRAFDVWTAICINTAFYAITHVPKSLKEAVGSIPMGIFLCWLTLFTGTIWLALFAHVMLSFSNLLFSLHFHPDIEWIGSNRSIGN